MDNCKNCGANSFKDNKCNYCGTKTINKTNTYDQFITPKTINKGIQWLPSHFYDENGNLK